MIPRDCKRLEEVDFPIAVVSKHAAREKSIRHGHPSTLHLWWARRPLSLRQQRVWFVRVRYCSSVLKRSKAAEAGGETAAPDARRERSAEWMLSIRSSSRNGFGR